MELRHRIDGIEEMIEAMRQQIIALTQPEQRRKARRRAAAGWRGTRRRRQGADASDVYYPPAMQPVSDS
jgi:hypothetical protein